MDTDDIKYMHYHLLTNCIISMTILIIFFNVILYFPLNLFNINTKIAIQKVIIDILMFILIGYYLNILIKMNDARLKRHHYFLRIYSVPIGILSFVIFFTNLIYIDQPYDDWWISLQMVTVIFISGLLIKWFLRNAKKLNVPVSRIFLSNRP